MKFDRPATRRAYRSDLSDFFGTDDITLDLALDVSFVRVNQYIASLEASGAKASTIRRRVAAIRGFFDWLEALGAIEKNPAHRQLIRKIKSVRNKDRVLVVLTAEQAKAIPNAKEGDILLSMRNVNMLAVLDPQEQKIVWAMVGSWRVPSRNRLN